MDTQLRTNTITLPQAIIYFTVIQAMWMILGSRITAELFSLVKHPSLITTYLMLHVNFVFLLLILVLFIYHIHRSSITSYVTDAVTFRYKLMFISMGVWITVTTLVVFVLFLIDPNVITLHKSSHQYSFIFTLIILILTPLQAIAEELLFRTTLWRLLQSHIKKGYLLCCISAVLFAVAHLSNFEVQHNKGVTLLYYSFVGFLFMYLTIQSRGSEIAFGFHIANNLLVALVFTYPNSSLQAQAIFALNKAYPLLDILILITASYILNRINTLFSSKKG